VLYNDNKIKNYSHLLSNDVEQNVANEYFHHFWDNKANER